MNLSSIILILQMALSLLANPNLAANSTLKAQALNFADQAIAIASVSLAQSQNTPSVIKSVATTTTSSNVPSQVSSVNQPQSQQQNNPLATPTQPAPTISTNSIPTVVTSTQSSVITASSTTATTTVQASQAITVRFNPSASGLVQLAALGSTNNALASFWISETSETGNVWLTSLTITDVTQSAQPSFANMTLWIGAGDLGTTTAVPLASGNGYSYTFHFSPSLGTFNIPSGSTVVLTLKGDVASNATVGSTHLFQVANPGDVTVLASTPAPITISPLTMGSNTVTITAQ